MKHVMFDLETLSTRTDAAVLSLGAVKFDETQLLPEGEFYVSLNMGEQIGKHSLYNRAVDAGTVLWWLGQSEEARKAIIDAPTRLPIYAALQMFAYYMEGVDQVWCRGLNFDVPILDSLYQQCSIPTPWKYNAARDSRTICELLPKELEPKASGAAHNALDDARNEALKVIATFQHLRRFQPEAATSQ